MKKQLLILSAMFMLVGCDTNNAEPTAEDRYHELENKIDYTPYFVNGEIFVCKEETKLVENDVKLLYRVALTTKEVEYNYYCTSHVINCYIIAENRIETSWLY